MTLLPDTAHILTVAQLLTHSMAIPAFQRPYDWRNEKVRGRTQIADFISDIKDSIQKMQPLFLGMIVACKDENGVFQIIDGQQRLTTLMLALGTAGRNSDLVDLNVFPTRSWIKIKTEDQSFFEKLVSGVSTGEATTLSQQLLRDAHEALANSSLRVEHLLQCRLIMYTAPSIAGATSLFERINLRGKEVSQFDLVKNKLIEWSGSCPENQKDILVTKITASYADLYRMLNPAGIRKDQEYDSDRLLRLHWILFDHHAFSSSDRVLEKIDQRLREEFEPKGQVAKYISDYLDDLVEVCRVWLRVEDPLAHQDLDQNIKDALLNFVKIDSDAELQPLAVAALLRLKAEAAPVINMCELVAFRTSLANKRSNYGRLRKWRFAKEFKQHTLKDDLGDIVESAANLNHQMFWSFCPYWEPAESISLGGGTLSREEIDATIFPLNSLESPIFYKSYGHLIHYIFWNYGRYLPKSKKWKSYTRSDLNPLTHESWFSNKKGEFGTWDIEHIYPINSADKDTPAGRKHAALMSSYIHHLGNLTVLPLSENRKWKNADFSTKLPLLQEAVRVSFNSLLSERDYIGNRMSKNHWGENNCKKRILDIKEFASERWGVKYVKQLGVGKYDGRVGMPVEDDELLEQE